MGDLSQFLSTTEFIATQHRELWPTQLAAWNAQPALGAAAARFGRLVYDKIRLLVGELHTTSGYRCPELNHAVGGRPNSRHLLALATDVVPVACSLEEAILRIQRSIDEHGEPAFLDEAIIEAGWLHIQGCPPGARARRWTLRTVDGKAFSRVA